MEHSGGKKGSKTQENTVCHTMRSVLYNSIKTTQIMCSMFRNVKNKTDEKKFGKSTTIITEQILKKEDEEARIARSNAQVKTKLFAK